MDDTGQGPQRTPPRRDSSGERPASPSREGRDGRERSPRLIRAEDTARAVARPGTVYGEGEARERKDERSRRPSPPPPKRLLDPADLEGLERPRHRLRHPPGGWRSTMACLLVLAGAAYYFWGGGRLWALRVYYSFRHAKAPVEMKASCDPAKAQEVVALVKAFRPAYSLQTLGSRLGLIQGWLREHGVNIVVARWHVSALDADHFRVSYSMVGNSYVQKWRWRVNLKRGIVFPSNPSAERLTSSDAHFGALFAEPELPPSPAVPTPAVAASPPQGEEVSHSAPRVKRPHAAAGPAGTRLVGMMASRGEMIVLFELAGKAVELQVGETLPNGWILRQAVRRPEGGGFVRLSHEGATATLELASTTLFSVNRKGSGVPPPTTEGDKPSSKEKPGDPAGTDADDPEEDASDGGEDPDDDKPKVVFPAVRPEGRIDREKLGLPDLRTSAPRP